MAKAFQGAEGWGAQSIGGRGGTVIEVINLNDSGAGSLREALTTSGPRIVVFRVAGLISLESVIKIQNPYITIAGQTAPGGGIHINNHIIRVSSHNMIIRYLRWRGGKTSFLSFRHFYDCHDIIVDHCSMSWGDDDILDIWKGSGVYPDMRNITIQNCLIAEPDPSHATGMMCGASLESDPEVEHILKLHHISIHHNLFVHSSYRNPRIKSRHTEVINNVVYNWAARIGGTERASEVDWINNYYARGPMREDDVKKQHMLRHASWASGGDPVYDNASLYISGNIAPNFPLIPELADDPNADNWSLMREYSNPGLGDIISLDHRRYSPLEPAPFPVPIQPAINAYASVLADVGANARLNSSGSWVANIDETDTRLLADVVARTGPSDYRDIIVPGTIGDIDEGTAYTDTDSDGMPDEWENLHGLDSNDATDGPEDASDGYTNIEIFLNGENEMTVITDLQTIEDGLRQYVLDLTSQADAIARVIIDLQVLDDQLDQVSDIIDLN